MKVRILITLKKGVLDTQGKAIENSLVKNLGFSQISQVRQGKLVEVDIEEKDQDKIKLIVDQICDKLLVNKVIEDYSYEILG
jgi:phosphoribosylformylglycinamidine synthase PurS subunit